MEPISVVAPLKPWEIRVAVGAAVEAPVSSWWIREELWIRRRASLGLYGFIQWVFAASHSLLVVSGERMLAAWKRFWWYAW